MGRGRERGYRGTCLVATIDTILINVLNNLKETIPYNHRGAGSDVAGGRLQHLELPRKSRGLVMARKPDRNPSYADRIRLWLSTKREVDGFWVGSMEDDPYQGLRRVEDALQLIKRHDPLNYLRVTRNLDKIWVHLIPSAEAHYERTLNACVLDERYLLKEEMTLDRIASTIVHEATHARLERWGIVYEEESRYRIESICLRRELNFLTKLPDSEHLKEEIARALEWCATDRDHLSDASFREREDQGQLETLRYLGAPSWVVRLAMWLIRRRWARASG